jgi:hypothetical protein
MAGNAQRVVFRDADGQIRWFDSAQAELKWSGQHRDVPFALENLVFLPGNRWLIYHDSDCSMDNHLSEVRQITDAEALDWLLVRGEEPPACLRVALEQRSIIQPADQRNKNLLRVEDEDDGHRPVVVDVSGASCWGPYQDDEGDYDPFDQVPTWFYNDYLYRLASGRFVRYRERSHREADIPFDPLVKRLSDEDAAEWLLLRGFVPPEDISAHADACRFKDEVPQKPEMASSDEGAPVGGYEASEEMRQTYRDPDNYWRNVWLYGLRRDGKTNRDMLSQLSERGQEFAPLESENALRSAIDSIAQHHNWPALKGTPGRPKAKSKNFENPSVPN